MMGELKRRLVGLVIVTSRHREYLQKAYQQVNRRRNTCNLQLRRNYKKGESQAKGIEIVQWGKSGVLLQGGLLPLQVSIEPQRFIILLSYYPIILLFYCPIVPLSDYIVQYFTFSYLVKDNNNTPIVQWRRLRTAA